MEEETRPEPSVYSIKLFYREAYRQTFDARGRLFLKSRWRRKTRDGRRGGGGGGEAETRLSSENPIVLAKLDHTIRISGYKSRIPV